MKTPKRVWIAFGPYRNIRPIFDTAREAARSVGQWSRDGVVWTVAQYVRCEPKKGKGKK